MKLKLLKTTKGIYNTIYQKGEVIDYHPWPFEWQGMTEPDRIRKGIFVRCFGMGEFEIFREGEDVERTEKEGEGKHGTV